MADRVVYWEHEDGTKASIGVLRDCLSPFASELCNKSVDLYPSVDFKSGIDDEALVGWHPLLLHLINVDDRGAYFKQHDMRMALQDVFDSKGMMEEVQTNAQQASAKSECNVLELMAYKIRVM